MYGINWATNAQNERHCWSRESTGGALTQQDHVEAKDHYNTHTSDTQQDHVDVKDHYNNI